MRGGPSFGMNCMICGYMTEESDDYACTTEGCPCQGTVPGTREAGVAAARWQRGHVAYTEPGYRDPRVAAWNAADMAEARSARSARARQAPALRRLDGQVAREIMQRREILERRAAREDPLGNDEALAWLAEHTATNGYGS